MSPLGIIAAALVIFAGAAMGQETVETIALETQQSYVLAIANVSAAYSLDPGVADVVLEPAGPLIVAVAPGVATVVIVTADHSEKYIQVVVHQSSSGSDRSAPSSGRTGAFETQYDSFSRRLQNIMDVAVQNGERVTTVRVNYTRFPRSPDGRVRHAIPLASYRILERGRELVILDDAVRSSPLTVDGVMVRGLHLRERGLQLHVGVSSYAFFNNLLLSRQRQVMAGVDYRRPLNPRTALIPRLYFFPTRDSSRGGDGVVAALAYEYLDGTALQVMAEAAASRRLSDSRLLPGGYLTMSRMTPRDRMFLRTLYQPDGFASLVGAIHGFRSDGLWLRSITARLSSSLVFDGNHFMLGSFQQTSRNLHLSMRYAFLPRWTVSGGGRYAYFDPHTVVRSPITSYEIPVGVEYSTPPFNAALEYRTTKSSASPRRGNGVHAALRCTSQNLSVDFFADRSTQTPTLDLIFSENPGLELALKEFGLQASTPAQLTRLLREHPELVNFGAIRGVNVDLSPVHYQAGSNLWWKGRWDRSRLGLSTSYTRDELVSQTREAAFASLSYTYTLVTGLTASAQYSRFFSRAQGVLSESGGWQVSFRQQVDNLPSPARFFATTGSITGVVFADPDQTGQYDASMPGVDGAEILLDGVVKAVSSGGGRFRIDHVIARDRHPVEIRYQSRKPFRFTTPPLVSAHTGNAVSFGIGPIAGHVTVFLRSADRFPINNVRVAISDRTHTWTRQTIDGKASLDVGRSGTYEVSLNTESVPPGYVLVDAAPRSVVISEGHSATVEFVLKANRSIGGRLRSQTEPLAGVQVILQPDGRTSTTDGEGNYLFRNVSPGAHVVTAGVGGARLQRDVEVPPGPSALRDIDLHVASAVASVPDLPAAARRLAIARPAEASVSGHEFAVQLGAFREQEHVREALGDAERARFHGYVTKQRSLELVRVGPFATRGEAREAVRQLAALRIDAMVVETGKVPSR